MSGVLNGISKGILYLGSRKGKNVCSITSFTIIIQFLSMAIRKEKNKRHKYWKERNITVSTCRWQDILHRKCWAIYKKPTGTNELTSKVQGQYRKENAFLYTSNKQLKMKLT